MKRLLNVEEASSYCGMSPGLFQAHVGVVPLRFGRRKVWDIKALDLWIDRQSGVKGLTKNEWLDKVDAGNQKGNRA